MNGTNAALFAPGIGDTLPNGAVVEAIRLNHNPADPDHLGYGVVLANRGTKYEPWVTWAVGIEVLAGVAEICTVSGHYFETVVAAADDYNHRTAGFRRR